MRNVVIAVLLLLAVTCGAAYFYFHGKEYVIRIPEAEIKSKLGEHLPVTKTFLLVFQITLDNPRVQLQNHTSRINAGIDVQLNIDINHNPKPLGGSIDISGGVEYMSETGQFFLFTPTIDQLHLQGIPEKYEEKLERALGKALDEYYRTHPIYTLSRLDTKQAVARLVLKHVDIEDKELVLTIGL